MTDTVTPTRESGHNFRRARFERQRREALEREQRLREVKRCYREHETPQAKEQRRERERTMKRVLREQRRRQEATVEGTTV